MRIKGKPEKYTEATAIRRHIKRTEHRLSSLKKRLADILQKDEDVVTIVASSKTSKPCKCPVSPENDGGLFADMEEWWNADPDPACTPWPTAHDWDTPEWPHDFLENLSKEQPSITCYEFPLSPSP